MTRTARLHGRAVSFGEYAEFGPSCPGGWIRVGNRLFAAKNMHRPVVSVRRPADPLMLAGTFLSCLRP